MRIELFKEELSYATDKRLQVISTVMLFKNHLYHSAWADQRLAPVLQIICNLVYKWL